MLFMSSALINLLSFVVAISILIAIHDIWHHGLREQPTYAAGARN